MTDYRNISMWHDTAGDEWNPRPSLPGPTEVDVAIIGAGFTGLWTAYYLKKTDPSLRIAVVEKEVAGFGPSGRNGGWCSHLFATPLDKLAKDTDRQSAIAQHRAMFDTVREVGRVVSQEGIDCDFYQGGNLHFATTPAQLTRLQQEMDHFRSWGFGEEDYRLLSAEEAKERIAVNGALGAIYTPHCAGIHPAKLARGLARSVEALGVPIYEKTTALEILANELRTSHGSIKAEVIVRATETYTTQLPGLRRSVVPVYSLMVATEPLSDETWEEIGWQERECWADARHLLVYILRTADNRIAMGGRGAPYHFGSRIDPSYEQEPKVFNLVKETMSELLPPTAKAKITHRWGGPVGLPRDWYSSVGLDRSSGIAWAGGYVGDGVSTTNLAGRTLADLITETDSDLTSLPWVNHKSRKWEPEPLRWIAVNLTLGVMGRADAEEHRTGRPSRRAQLLDKLVGR